MKVCCVAQNFNPKYGTGVARYANMIVSTMENNGFFPDTISCEEKEHTKINTTLDWYWRLPLKIAEDKGDSDIYHFLSPQFCNAVKMAKLKGKKTIVTVHDLHAHFLKMKLVDISTKMSCDSSDMIIAISTQTKEDLIKYYQIPEEKIIVINLAVDDRFYPISGRYKNRDFTVGYLGGYRNYKNVEFLIDTFLEYSAYNKNARLVLYGNGNDYLKFKSGYGDNTQVKFPGYAEESELNDIYNSFDLFVFPSKMEGFGFPILEALKCRTPVAVLENSHIPKEVKRTCLKFKTKEDLMNIMDNIHKHGIGFTEEHIMYLEHFNWKRCANETLRVYEDVYL